jgi:hypothetical protein
VAIADGLKPLHRAVEAERQLPEELRHGGEGLHRAARVEDAEQHDRISFCRLRIGNTTTAVAMLAMISSSSRRTPRRMRLSWPAPAM